VSEDGCYAARYPIETGKGWHKRELRMARHMRLDRLAMI
jgi:hypothetical protein